MLWAIEYYQKALNLGHPESEEAIIRCRTRIANSYFDIGRKCESSENYRHAVDNYRKAKDFGHASCDEPIDRCERVLEEKYLYYLSKGNEYEQYGSYDSAIKYYEQILVSRHPDVDSFIQRCNSKMFFERGLKAESNNHLADACYY